MNKHLKENIFKDLKLGMIEEINKEIINEKQTEEKY